MVSYVTIARYSLSSFSYYAALVLSEVHENEGHVSVKEQMGVTGRNMQQGK